MATEFRKNYKNGFTTVGNELFHDRDLNCFDRGLLLTMFSLPDDWKFSVSGLAQILKDGKDAINSSINRLEELGYLKRSQIRNDDGRLAKCIYEFYDYRAFSSCDSIKSKIDESITDEPMTDNLTADEPLTGEPLTGEPLAENPQTVNTGETQKVASSEPLTENPQTVNPSTENPSQYNKNNKNKNNLSNAALRGNAAVATSELDMEVDFIFSKPSFEDVKAYALEKDLLVDPRYFYEFYENVGWIHQSGKYAGKYVRNWKNAMLMWHKMDAKKQTEPGGVITTQTGKRLTWEEQKQLRSAKQAIEMFDPKTEPEEYNELKQQIDELEGRC